MAERVTGILQSFKTEKLVAHGYVRLSSGELVHVAVRDRGILQGKDIDKNINGCKYQSIEPGTPIALDVTYDSERKNPFVCAWAPKK